MIFASPLLLLRRLKDISLSLLVGGTHIREGSLLGPHERHAALGSTCHFRGRLGSFLFRFRRDRSSAFVVLRWRHVLLVLAFGVTLAFARLIAGLCAPGNALSWRRLIVAALAVAGIVTVVIVKSSRDIDFGWCRRRLALVDAAGGGRGSDVSSMRKLFCQRAAVVVVFVTVILTLFTIVSSCDIFNVRAPGSFVFVSRCRIFVLAMVG
jgi:hypothetical protein